MHLADSVVVRASRDRVWDFMLDPVRVTACFPQVEGLERVDETHVRASVPVRVAFLALRIAIEVELVEQLALERAVFRLHATGAGSTADGTATFVLAPAEVGGMPGAGTAVEWSADVVPTGMAAALGPATLEREAGPALQRAIDCLRRAVEAP